METKLHKRICRVIDCLANLMILFFIFLIAFLAVCCAISTILDFNILSLLMSIVFTSVWLYLLRVKEDK